MKKKTTIYSDKNYALQAGRNYKVTPIGHWMPSYSEEVTLTKINRYGQATVVVGTNSVLVGTQTVVIQAEFFTWVEA